MLQLRDQPRVAEHPQRPQLVDGDHDRLVGLAVTDVRYEAVVAGLGESHDAGGAVDGDRRPIDGFVLGEVHTQSMRNPCDSVSGLQGLDGGAGATPAAGDGLDDVVEHGLLLDGEPAADRVVVERLGPTGLDHVEAGEIPARRAPVPRAVDHGGRG